MRSDDDFDCREARADGRCAPALASFQRAAMLLLLIENVVCMVRGVWASRLGDVVGPALLRMQLSSWWGSDHERSAGRRVGRAGG